AWRLSRRADLPAGSDGEGIAAFFDKRPPKFSGTWAAHGRGRGCRPGREWSQRRGRGGGGGRRGGAPAGRRHGCRLAGRAHAGLREVRELARGSPDRRLVVYVRRADGQLRSGASDEVATGTAADLSCQRCGADVPARGPRECELVLQ